MNPSTGTRHKYAKITAETEIDIPCRQVTRWLLARIPRDNGLGLSADTTYVILQLVNRRWLDSRSAMHSLASSIAQ